MGVGQVSAPDWDDPTFTTWWAGQTGYDDPLDLAELVALGCALVLAGVITVTGWRKWTR